MALIKFLLILCTTICIRNVRGKSVSISALTKPIDLTWGFDMNTIYWPGSKSYEITKRIAGYRNNGSFWYAINDFCAGEHGGTHLDAPFHFNKNGWKVGEIPLERLIVPGIVIDVEDSENLNVNHLKKWIELHGEIPRSSAILIRFGRAKFYSNRTKYLGIDENGNLNFPGITKEAATWLTNSTQIVGIGVDTSSVDPGNSTDFMAHQIFSEHQIYCLENVNIPMGLPLKGFMLYIMPMKIVEGTGAPLRIIAVPGPDFSLQNN